MNDISTVEMGLNIDSVVNERRERQVREGLSKQDESLSVGQNIVRVYGHTPELQWLGKAIACGDEVTLGGTIQRASESMRKYYKLNLVIKSDSEVVKITRNPDNKATLRGNDIFICDSLTAYPLDMAIELSHELGAARLISIYGSKDNIPRGLPDPEGGGKLFAATHYLDWYVRSAGIDRDIINTVRRYIWRAGQLIKR